MLPLLLKMQLLWQTVEYISTHPSVNQFSVTFCKEWHIKKQGTN